MDGILRDSEFAYGSKENYLSLFSIQAINNNTKLIYVSLKKEKINLFKNMYLKINFLGSKTNKKIKIYKNDLNKIHTYNSILKNYLLNL